jgi:hypothetical protein
MHIANPAYTPVIRDDPELDSVLAAAKQDFTGRMVVFQNSCRVPPPSRRTWQTLTALRERDDVIFKASDKNPGLVALCAVV